MRPSRIKTKLARDEPVLVTSLHLTDPSVFEMTSMMGFDGIWMDLEHHGYSLETAGNLMRAARTGPTDIIARPAKGEFMRMGRLLEAGAQGIMYPRCDNAEEAAEVVRWAKFPPLGQRGFDGGNPDARYCSIPMEKYVLEANENSLICIQLEHSGAIDQAEAIASVPGVDMLMLGPADFALSRDIPGQLDHALLDEARLRIADAARKAGKQWGCPCATTQAAQKILEMGARVIFHQADILMVRNGLQQIQQDFSPLGFTFDDRTALA